MSNEQQDPGLPVRVRRWTEPPANVANVESSTSSDSDDTLEMLDSSMRVLGASEYAASDVPGFRANHEDPHSELDTGSLVKSSAVVSEAASALGGQKRPLQRHQDSGHGKKHSNRSETHRTGRTDKPFWGFKTDKSGTDPTREHLLIEIKERDQTINDLDDEYYRIKKTNKKLKRDMSDLAKENDKLQRLIDDQDSQIRTVQDHQLRKVEAKGFLHAEDDRTVRQRLRTFTSRWKSWAKEYAVPNLDQIKGTERMAAMPLFRFLGVPDELLLSKAASVAPGIILHAALSMFVTNWIIRQPFFSLSYGLRTEGEATSESLHTSKAFDSEYQRILRMNGDVSMAHAWRSLTLRLFDPPEHESKLQPEIYQESLRRKDQYYQEIAKRFDDHHKILYRQAYSSQRERELFEILRSAGELFSSLWKQKVFIDPRWDCYTNKPFNVASHEMEAHAALRLEEGDTKMDGCPVQMVVQPAVLAFGNEEGKQYNESKVWAKAVVWLGGTTSR